ncbi:MAG: hypothetical protein KDE35_08250 [Geminicoccaceae bacterium]|nr:hypothetical protein [Geminicoccaceae bacterium]
MSEDATPKDRERGERLAALMRANLHKRKAQARARAEARREGGRLAPGDETGGTDEEDDRGARLGSDGGRC